jgi:hypothetical protein
MVLSMQTTSFKIGEKVRHAKRPEWGVGSIAKIEVITRDGRPDRRIWIRFPGVGEKTVLASMAELEHTDGGDVLPGAPTLADLHAQADSGWLGEISKRKPEDLMSRLPDTATDPFVPLRRRLEFVLGLYRFDAHGKLIEWAIAQSGLNDPMSRFSRHDLEAFFQRWKFALDAQLGKLLQEARREPGTLEAASKGAPPAAQAAVRRISAYR